MVAKYKPRGRFDRANRQAKATAYRQITHAKAVEAARQRFIEATKPTVAKAVRQAIIDARIEKGLLS